MAEIINLRKARKDRARAEAERQAEANRVKFGRSRAEKEASRAEAKRQERHLDGKKLESGETEP